MHAHRARGYSRRSHPEFVRARQLERAADGTGGEGRGGEAVNRNEKKRERGREKKNAREKGQISFINFHLCRLLEHANELY